MVGSTCQEPQVSVELGAGHDCLTVAQSLYRLSWAGWHVRTAYRSVCYFRVFKLPLHGSMLTRVIISRRMRWAGHVARMGAGRGVYRVLVGKLEGKTPLGRPRRRWEDNVKMDLQEVGCGGMDWIELAQDRDRWRTLTWMRWWTFGFHKMRGIS